MNLENRVALITGAGGGLGRSHALLFAQLGAKVVVNDPGVSVDGSSANEKTSDETVRIIRAAGGEAVADTSSVETMAGANRMIDCALKNFGKIDIVVNNAGILRDGSFKKQDDESWKKIIDVHLNGARNVTKAAWDLMCFQNYGRVIFTTSASGLYGNFGQSNYAAAKMGLWGLMQALKEEGMKHQIFLNAIAPIAHSRMTQNILPDEMLKKLDPAFISPWVAYLASDRCGFSGSCFSVGGGKISRVMVMENEGAQFHASHEMSLENLEAQMQKILSTDHLSTFDNLMGATAKLVS